MAAGEPARMAAGEPLGDSAAPADSVEGELAKFRRAHLDPSTVAFKRPGRRAPAAGFHGDGRRSSVGDFRGRAGVIMSLSRDQPGPAISDGVPKRITAW